MKKQLTPQQIKDLVSKKQEKVDNKEIVKK